MTMSESDNESKLNAETLVTEKYICMEPDKKMKNDINLAKSWKKHTKIRQIVRWHFQI